MKKKRLAYYVFFNVMLIGITALAITSYLWINNIYDTYARESARIQEEYTNKVRDELKKRVDTIVSFINYRKASTEALLQQDVRNRVNELHSLMTYLYNANQGKLNNQEIQTLITESVRGVRYNNGRGYYFIDTLAGDVVLYPVAPESEGKNLYYLQDERGNFSLQQEIALVKQHGQGFIEGYWKKPGNDAGHDHKKITFVKKFEHFNWYFGTGEYTDVIEQQVKDELKGYVNQLTYGKDRDQYVFIHDFQGVELANGLYPSLVGQNHFQLPYSQGANFVHTQIKLASTPPYYGFLTHLWPTPNGTEKDKLTYVAGIPQWNWVVGSGTDMEALNTVIAAHQDELYQQLVASLKNAIIVAITILALSLIAARHISRKINNSLRLFTLNMQQSSAQLSVIDHDRVVYKEFEELANVSNDKTNKINNLLYKDELTGLYNRRYINQLLNQLVDTSQQEQSPLSLVMIDIDHFKQVNDNYGHQLGDEVLIAIAHIIQSYTKDKGIVGRFGGEEILVILPNTTEDQAFQLASNIRQKIELQHFDHIKHTITISAGISSGKEHTGFELIRQADDNLYKAKRNGRNRVER